MNLPSDQIAQGVVDHTMLLDERLSLEGVGYDQDRVVTAARGGTGVPGVPGGVVDQLEMDRSKAIAQDRLDSLRRAHLPHLSSDEPLSRGAYPI